MPILPWGDFCLFLYPSIRGGCSIRYRGHPIDCDLTGSDALQTAACAKLVTL